jgi:hypothetical protein
LILLLLFACKQAPTPSPTPDLTPKPTDVLLNYPKEIAPDDVFFIEANNQGTLPYIINQPIGENCLNIEIRDAEEEYFPASLPTCDVLAAIIIEPGQNRLVGSWDLMICLDIEDCLQRIPAPPNDYVLSVVAHPFSGDISKLNASSDKDVGPGFELTATFTLTE